VGQCLLAAGGLSASLERFHGRKVNLGNAIELRPALSGDCNILVATILVLPARLEIAMGTCSFLIDRFECLDVLGLWIRHD